jgi:hypothetical protein
LIKHNGKLIRLAVHGDDIACAGAPADLKWLRARIEERFETKVQALGIGPGETKVVKLLDRIITLCRGGITMEGDPRHTQAIIEELGLRRQGGQHSV